MNKEKQKDIEKILEHFRWSGTTMLFPVTNGNAIINLEDLIKIIKFPDENM